MGLAFHACLLLVLVAWRPAGDDPALFHVISAAWGVCNAIWETLIHSESNFLTHPTVHRFPKPVNNDIFFVLSNSFASRTVSEHMASPIVNLVVLAMVRFVVSPGFARPCMHEGSSPGFGIDAVVISGSLHLVRNSFS